MIHECIEANREKFVRYAKIAKVIGWVLIIVAAVMMVPTIFQHRLVGHGYPVEIWQLGLLLLLIISPVFYGTVFLLLAQFIKCELGLEKRPGWFFRNGSGILKGYAAVVIGGMALQYAFAIYALVKSKGPFWGIFLSFFTPNLMYIINIAKVLLLWGLAGAVKLMLEEIRKKDGMGHLNVK